MSDPLVELLKAEECSPLLSRLRKKVQRGEALTGRCRLSKLTREQKACISELTGANRHGAGITVDLDLFAQIVVNTGRLDSLETLVQLACGEPLPNLRAARDEQSAEWQRVWEHAAQRIGELSSSHKQSVDAEANRTVAQTESLTPDLLNDAITSMRRSGWLRRLTSRDPIKATLLLDQAFALLKQLPVRPVPLSVFAANHCGSAHALDDDASLGRIMLKLLAKRPVNDTSQKKAVKRRRIWESVGIVTDELSSTVLALNLPATGHTLTDRLLQDHLRCGMPVRLTFRHLRLHPPTFRLPSIDRESRIHVCENPSILAEAATRIGANCPPMVCVEGHPSLACWVLFEQLCSSEFRLAYHGDFDWGGVRIANKIYAAFGFEPWRFTSASYRIRSQHHRKLRPPESEAWWDPSLAETIRRAGVSVEEESAIDELLADLAHSSPVEPTTNE